MPVAVRAALIGLSLTFLAVSMSTRIRAAQSRERLRMAKRRAGPPSSASGWQAWRHSDQPRRGSGTHCGLHGPRFRCLTGTRAGLVSADSLSSITWLIWMFISLGPNLTDTVVTRRNARFVERGPVPLREEPDVPGGSS